MSNETMEGKKRLCLTLELTQKSWPTSFSGPCNGMGVVAGMGFPPAGPGLLLFIFFCGRGLWKKTPPPKQQQIHFLAFREGSRFNSN